MSRGGRPFTVTCVMLSGREVKLIVKKHHKIGWLIEQLAWALNVPEHRLVLVQDGELMNVDRELRSYMIYDDTMVQLVIRSL